MDNTINMTVHFDV